MARLLGYIETKGSAKHDIKYRYKCERCGEYTEWTRSAISQYSIKIRRVGSISDIAKSGGNGLGYAENAVLAVADDQLRADGEAEKRVGEVVAGIKGVLKGGNADEVLIDGEPFLAEIYNDIFSLGNACPSCGSRQTWYPAVYEPTSAAVWGKKYAVRAGLACAVCAFLYLFFVSGGAARDLIHSVAAVCAGAAVGLAFGYARAKLIIDKKRTLCMRTAVRRKPEVDWNGV